MSTKVKGLDKVMRALARVARSVPGAVQEHALKAAGEIIAERARQLVPVDSGELRDSIGVSLGARNFSSVSLREDGVTVVIGPSKGKGYYGHMVEFGTVNMAAEPFMRPAIDQTREEVQTVISEALWAKISAAAKG